MPSITDYDHLTEILSDGTIDMDNDTFNVALLTNAHVFNAADTIFADVSGDEIAAGNGYTAAGQALTTVTWAQVGGTVKFDADDTIWTASGGPIATSRYAVIYSLTADRLMFFIDMDSDKSPGDGDSLTLQWDPANGIFTGLFV